MGFQLLFQNHFRHFLGAALMTLIAVVAVGCGSGQVVTIRTVPPDASIVVDGEPRPRGPITERFSFAGGQFHTVLVTRAGYTDKTILLDGTSDQSEVVIQLKPRTRRVRFFVSPYPAIVKIDGQPISNTPVLQASAELEFAVDASNKWISHVVTAERGGFKTDTKTINFTDVDPIYNLVLTPERKTVTIKTDPPGAEVIVDGTNFGPSPVTIPELVIVMDPQSNQWVGRSVRAVMPGLEPATGEISWDEGRTEYVLKLGTYSKTIRIKTDPPDAVVRMGDKSLPRKPDGVVEAKLDFAPLNAAGELPVHELAVAPPAGLVQKFEPRTLKVGWEDGRVDYLVTLDGIPGVQPMPDTRPTEITPTDPKPPTRPAVATPQDPPATRPVVDASVTPAPPPPASQPTRPPVPGRTLTMLSPVFRHEKGVWLVEPGSSALPVVRSTAEPDGRKPVLIYKAAKGVTPDGVTTSSDGSLITWVALQQKPAAGGNAASLRSQLFAMATTDSKTPIELTDGQTLDLMPSFSPDSQRLLFTSDRIGEGRLGSYEMMIAAQGFAVRAAPGETADTELSPTLDSLPRPRLYVEARPCTGGEARLVAIETVSGKRVDLGQAGMQPRISPRADAVVFVRADARTGQRDIWLLKLGGDNEPINLTQSPDDDDYDPAWSKTGSRIAFASNRNGGNKPSEPDINLWVLRVAKPTELMQVTDNDARDDNPTWSGDDTSMYFRSSRGGDWGIWRIDLPK